MQFNSSVDSILGSKSRIKILRHLFMSQAQMSEGELAKMIGTSSMSINRIMKEFQALNLVYSHRAGNSTIWKINKKSYFYDTLDPIISGIIKITPPLDHLKNVILKTLPLKLLRKVIVYGSIASGRENAGSDIDLFIMVKNEADKNQLKPFLDILADKCLNYYGNSLSPYVLSKNELIKKRKTLILEIEKGMHLYP